jgi:hypothetical protein
MYLCKYGVIVETVCLELGATLNLSRRHIWGKDVLVLPCDQVIGLIGREHTFVGIHHAVQPTSLKPAVRQLHEDFSGISIF